MNKETQQKPIANVVGQNGNVFNIIAICSKALKEVGMRDEAKEMQTKVMSSGGYDEALGIMGDYCDLR